jgi:hypothetical protein
LPPPSSSRAARGEVIVLLGEDSVEAKVFVVKKWHSASGASLALAREALYLRRSSLPDRSYGPAGRCG